MDVQHSGKILWVVGDASGDMAATLTSKAISLAGQAGLSVTLHAASDTHVGTLTAQVTDDTAEGSENWNSYDIGTVAASNGSAFNWRGEIGTSAAKIRFIYTASSGAGTLTGNYTAKNNPAHVDTELTITGSGLALETGGHLEAADGHLHSIDAKLPAALGKQLGAGSLAVNDSSSGFIGVGTSAATGAVEGRLDCTALGGATYPKTVLVHARGADMYLAQGSVAVALSGTAADNFILRGEAMIEVRIESAASAYIAHKQVAAAGVLAVTRTDLSAA